MTTSWLSLSILIWKCILISTCMVHNKKFQWLFTASTKATLVHITYGLFVFLTDRYSYITNLVIFYVKMFKKFFVPLQIRKDN